MDRFIFENSIMELTVENAHTPIRRSENLIDLMVKFHQYNEEMPFTSSPNDTEQYGRDLYQAAVSGDFGPIEDVQGEQ